MSDSGSGSRNVVIGTAGHVDHGKTSLVLALTGMETDRLAEEKRRGITIENGYARLKLPDGTLASIVDAPGHERFVRHMAAGAGGTDLALLTVAADDGVMPQTVEHLEILRLLGVRRAVVALTKRDLAPDDDWLELVGTEVRDLVAGVFETEPPIIRVSSLTGEGIEDLRAALFQAAADCPPHPVQNVFRLPVDRVFTMTGFGTVVTGTLLDGVVETGQTACVYPGMLEARIRQVQVHNSPARTAWPGQRTAVNIANLKKEDLRRGDVLGTAGALSPTLMLDVTVGVGEKSPHSLKTGREYHLHLLAGERVAKLVLLGADELVRGQTGYAQLRLKSPVVARRGDRFVLRMASPAVTAGGGEVVDGTPLKRKRAKTEVLGLFEIKRKGTHPERVELAVRERPGSFQSLGELIRRADLDPAKARADADKLAGSGVLVSLSRDHYLHRTEYDNLVKKLRLRLNDHHRREPHSPGVTSGQLRSLVMPGARQQVADSFFDLLASAKIIVREEAAIRLASFSPKINEAENEFLLKLEKSYREFGLNPLATSAVLPGEGPAQQRERKAAFAALVRRGDLVPLDELYHVHRLHYDQAKATFLRLAGDEGPVMVGRFRDILGSSRKVALALLESFERSGFAVKSGEGRIPRR
ncbi:MAG: selenocysteine-specific translation elongation factor [Deltaproteobacteria bacterium]|jgi:selenocysteine-specific elongation factor|nr:selenocysteine-specific translation elongation factor [Deltaproteobacteria bacterium]